MEDEHLKWAWAAYRRGAFDGNFDPIPPDLTPEKFRAALLELMGAIRDRGGELFALIGRTPLGEIPVGMAIVFVNGPFAEPHAVWFPEASPRNRLELMLSFLVELKRRYKIHLWVRERNWKLVNHMCKYGVVRTVGKRRNFFPDGEPAWLFSEVT